MMFGQRTAQQGEMPVLPEAWLMHTTHMGTAVQVNGVGQVQRDCAVVPIVCGHSEAATEYQRNYSWKSVCNAWDELRRCRVGARNATLNGLAYSLGRQIARGWVSVEQVEKLLLWACRDNGLIEDDGEEQCLATLKSGIGAGMRWPYHDIGSGD
jgi:hypothetical protein